MKTRCPECKTEQEPNSEFGDLDVCDSCGRTYNQFVNVIDER